MTSIAYLTNIATPYRVAMVNAWNQVLGEAVKITVYYTDPDNQGRGWQVQPMERADEIRLHTYFCVPKYGRLNRGLLHIANSHDILIIGGFEQASYLAAAALARLLGKKIILLFDGFSPHRFDQERRSIRLLKRITAGLCHAYFANGSVGRRYLHQLNAPERPIFNQYLSVSTREIDAVVESGANKMDLRRRYDLPACAKIVAFCGYLIPRKRPDLLIEAAALLPQAERPTVVFIGSGTLQSELAALAARVGVDARLLGFQNSVGLAELYRAVDMLVLPSSDDPWGLVVNEAMAAGLPVIVSDACGCAEDLVISARNGFVFQSGNAVELARCLHEMLAADLPKMGRCSQEIIEKWTPLHSARSLATCIANVLCSSLNSRTIAR